MAFDDEICQVAAAQLHSSAHYTRQLPTRTVMRADREHDADKADTHTTFRPDSTRFGRIKGMLRP